MGTRKQREKQEDIWIAHTELAVAPGHPFYQRLNELLEAEGFDEFVEGRCGKFYAEKYGRPSACTRPAQCPRNAAAPASPPAARQSRAPPRCPRNTRSAAPESKSPASAFLVFFRIVSGHRAGHSEKARLDEWVLVVIAGSVGLLLTLLVNAGLAFYLSFQSASPEVPPNFDQRLLVLETWGCLVPFVWGFSAKWLPVFLGLRPGCGRILLLAVALNSGGVLLALAGAVLPATVLLLMGLATAISALRLFEPAERPAKVKGVHSSFPFFVRLAYVWASIAAFLSLWAAMSRDSSGIWGASRHALTVGFLATMVFAIGQRVLPAFSGMRPLFSTKLMFLSLLLLAVGCLLRVSSEVLAYQGFVRSAWSWLPTFAIYEMTAVTLFAFNLLTTFAREAPAVAMQPLREAN